MRYGTSFLPNPIQHKSPGQSDMAFIQSYARVERAVSAPIVGRGNKISEACTRNEEAGHAFIACISVVWGTAVPVSAVMCGSCSKIGGYSA